MNKNVGLFVDTNDLYRKIRWRYNGKLHYGNYVASVAKLGRIIRATAYGSQKENEASSFIGYLRNNGFETKFKRPYTFKVGDQETKKCNWGIGITLDIVRNIDSLDIIVLGSTNPDLAPVISWLREKNKHVIVYACCIPLSFYRLATEVIEIGEEELE